MRTIDFSPLFRTSVGYDQLASLLDSSSRRNDAAHAYPPYNILVEGETNYRISLAVAGFVQEELNIETENRVLTITGQKSDEASEGSKFLHRGIAARNFERKFQLAEHVEVVDAKLKNGLLEVELVKQIPEVMKPKTIAIDAALGATTIEDESAKAA